ncbi:hypothetical protein BX616_001073, partial [Lobosporangium transversale]
MSISENTTAIVVTAVAGVLIAPILFKITVASLGFSPNGIVAGTPAAGMMSFWGGAVTAGSICAVLQSIGAGGLGVTGTAISGVAGGALA